MRSTLAPSLPTASTESPARGLDRRSWLARLVAILLLAGGLLGFDLGAKSLWDDEVRLVQIATGPDLVAVLGDFQTTERQPPLHYALMHGWIKIAGTSEVALRLPAALFSVGSVAAIAWLGRRLAGPAVALIAAYLLALSPLLALYGRMARYYSLALLLSVVSTAFFVEIRHRQRSGPVPAGLWLGYGLTTAAMLLTSYLAVAVLVTQVGWLGFTCWRERRSGRVGQVPPSVRSWLGWAGSLALVALVFGAWLAVELQRIPTFRWESPAALGTAGQSLLFLVSYPWYAYLLGATILPWHPLAVVGGVLSLLCIASGLRAAFRAPTRLGLPFLGALACVALGVIAFRTVTRDLGFNELPSRVIVALPFVVLGLGIGIAALPRRWQVPVLVGWTAVYAAGLFNYFTNQQFIDPTPAVPTREIVYEVLHESRPGDLILTHRDWVVTYYHDVAAAPPAGKPPVIPLAQGDAVRRALDDDRYRRIWLVQFNDFSWAYTPADLTARLERDYRLVESQGYLPQDGLYLMLRRLVQPRERPVHRVEVRLYERAR